MDSNGNWSHNWHYNQDENGNYLFSVRDTLTGLMGILDISGQVVFPEISFKYAYFNYLDDENGHLNTDSSSFNDIPERVFMVKDNADKYGFVTASGKVLFPEISFQYYSDPIPLSNRLFYIHNTNRTIRYYRNGVELNGNNLLINSHNQPLFPNAKVLRLSAVYNEKGKEIKGIYELYYEFKNKLSKVYMDKYGKVYEENNELNRIKN